MLDVRPLRATRDREHVAKSFLDIVNAPDFWFGDRFVEAGEVVSAFSEEDWVRRNDAAELAHAAEFASVLRTDRTG